MTRDFFDDDLLASDDKRPADQEIAVEAESDQDNLPAPAVPRAGQERMARQREEVANQVAGAMSEIERLRLKQQKLEQERNQLEELTRKQEEYERGKREIIQKLDRSVILLDKEEYQAREMAELLLTVKGRFRKRLDELAGIREEKWPEDGFAGELNKALALVDDTRAAYKKDLAKIEASSWHRAHVENPDAPAFEKIGKELHPERRFGFWLKAGTAFSLPLILVLIVLFVLNLFLMGLL